MPISGTCTESADPTLNCVSPEAFRNGMAGFPGTVNIVTTKGEEGMAGFTATAVCSVSDNPPTLLVCLNRGTSVYQVFNKSQCLAINTLDQGQEAISNLFGGKATMDERFASAQWDTLSTGAPALVGAAVTFDCIITERLSVATHDVFFCQVVDIKQQQDAGALLYHQRQYRQLTSTK
ncbi:flavin reductase [Paraglaciecola sp. 25GB23A]|uniref:flavin reductase n=1 Tax=Paraglaciecola sp. 25GB23A TaxID=3156068 RepID=UPI0032AFCBCA|tara:strand:- start:123 stop:656 length:534 start_codon:yes stop_codon:yes gene_type:complete